MRIIIKKWNRFKPNVEKTRGNRLKRSPCNPIEADFIITSFAILCNPYNPTIPKQGSPELADGEGMAIWKSWQFGKTFLAVGSAFALMVATHAIGLPTDACAQEARAGRLFGGKRGQERGGQAAASADQSLEESLRQETLRRIPWKELSAETRAKLRPVLAEPSIYRRLPDQAIYCHADIYNFLLEHPDTVVAFWEKMGVTQISLREIGKDRYRLKESGGTTATAEVVYRNPYVTIVYAKGTYRGPFLARAIEGETVLFLRSRFAIDEDGDPFVACRLDAFVSIHNPGADLIAKLLSPLVGKIADGNFEQTVGFIGSVSDAIDQNPIGIYRMTSRLPNISDRVRFDFQRLILETVGETYPVAVTEDESQIPVRLMNASEIPAALSATPEKTVSLDFQPATASGKSDEKSNRVFEPFLEPGQILGFDLNELTSEENAEAAVLFPEKSDVPLQGEEASVVQAIDESTAVKTPNATGRVVFKTPTLPKAGEEIGNAER